MLPLGRHFDNAAFDVLCRIELLCEKMTYVAKIAAKIPTVYLMWIFEIHEIFSLDWSDPVTWLITGKYPRNISQFSKVRAAKNIWRIINTIACIWRENMLGYLFLDIISPWKLTLCLELLSWKTIREQTSQHILRAKWRLLFI